MTLLDAMLRRPPALSAVTAAWVAHLDVDLAAAQTALRLSAADRQAPPGFPEAASFPEEPVTTTTPRPETLVAPPGTRLRGGYARRAAS